MRAGQLDRRVVVQRKSLSQSGSGEPIESWQTVGTTRWAYRFPVSGTERFTAEQFAALEQVEFRLRWSDDIADLQPQDRIIEPASDAGAPPARSTYDIIGVHEIGRREGLRVLTTRRVDVS
jgi:head-tail adaptor